MISVKTEYALLSLLAVATSIIVFPFLGVMPLRPDESILLDLAQQFSESGITSVFDENGTDFPKNFYAYFVSIVLNNTTLHEAFAVRLPSALTMQLLAIGMFLFRGSDEKMSKAFLASLLFLSSYSISSLTFHGNVASIMALALICSLSAIYHWIKIPTKTKAYIAITATACTSIFMGLIAPVATIAIAFLFLLIQGKKGFVTYFMIAAMIATSVALAYVSIIFITNDSLSAQNVLGIRQITETVGNIGLFSSFIGHLFFSIFPWSIPIFVAIFWIALHPKWIKDKFNDLTLLKQFGVIIFVMAIPTFIVLNRLSIVMLIAVIFFNMPVISSFLLSQLHYHSITWKITGMIFASIIGMITLLLAGIMFGIIPTPLKQTPEWTLANIAIILAIITCLYHQWRNRRTIAYSNIYLYNIVVIYILGQMLFKGYINPYIYNFLIV